MAKALERETRISMSKLIAFATLASGVIAVPDIRSRPPLCKMKLITVWRAILIRPDAFSLESDGIDDENIAVPLSDGFTKEARIRNLGMLLMSRSAS